MPRLGKQRPDIATEHIVPIADPAESLQQETKRRGRFAVLQMRTKEQKAALPPLLRYASLTDAQKVFVDSVGDKAMHPMQAAKRAGWTNPKEGAKLNLSHPAIAAELEHRAAKYEEAAQMTREKVMEGMKEAIDMARVQSDPSVMITGWREIGRLCGYYETKSKIEISVNGSVTIEKMQQMSDQDLLKIIEAEHTVIDA